MFAAKYRTLWLALVGPGVLAGVSVVGLSLAEGTLVESHLVRFAFLIVFVVLLFSVLMRAHRHENMNFERLGLRRPTVWTGIIALLLTLFFILVYGPFAFWLVDALGLGGFEAGLSRLEAVPTFFLVLNILIVAGGEEWLYRCYAIERLSDLTGNVWLAGLLSLLAFAVVHLPFWGVGPALTTLISGSILTVVYIKTRDITALIVAHVAVDLVGLVLMG